MRDCSPAVRSCSSQLAARLCAVRRCWFEAADLGRAREQVGDGQQHDHQNDDGHDHVEKGEALLCATALACYDPARGEVGRHANSNSGTRRQQSFNKIRHPPGQYGDRPGLAHRDCHLQLIGVFTCSRWRS